MTMAAELPISEARARFSEVVSEAAYAGRITYLTRHGRRVAVVASEAVLEAQRAKAYEAAIADVCARLWQSALDSGADEETRDRLRAAIDSVLAEAEEASDATAIDAAEADEDEAMPWESLKAELGL